MPRLCSLEAASLLVAAFERGISIGNAGLIAGVAKNTARNWRKQWLPGESAEEMRVRMMLSASRRRRGMRYAPRERYENQALVERSEAQ